MEKIRAMIVDDSGFAIRLIRESLERKGVEVVAEAEKAAEAVEGARRWKPDLITMDMTLPDGTGIDCAREILKENPKVRIIAVSSMMDTAIISEAREAGIKAFVQKPIREELLFDKIDRLFSKTMEADGPLESYEEAFAESFEENIRKIVDEDARFGRADSEEGPESFTGYLVSIGIIGTREGRMILSVSETAAESIAGKIFGKTEIGTKEIVAFFNEFANVIAGNAVSAINATDKKLGLRLSPPTVFQGRRLELSVEDVSNRCFTGNTQFGDIVMHIGFMRGECEWM